MTYNRNVNIMDWKKQARVLIRTELAKQDMSYKDLARRLEGIGLNIEPKAITNKVSRGSFSFVFFLQCMHVLGVESIQLK